ncbi:MAG: transposase [Treponema sp.]|jgi:REP element-mobilizing transposase RayT|nr:transposase [Treponema sp.]
MEARREIKFLEMGAERERERFLARSAPMYSPEQIVRTTKSVRARKTFERRPEVKKELWGGGFWRRECCVGGAGGHGDGQAMRRHAKSRGRKPEECQKYMKGNKLICFLIRIKLEG